MFCFEEKKRKSKEGYQKTYKMDTENTAYQIYV